MRTQLAERYLKNSLCRHGLYLVGWFNCDQWSDTDSRKKKAPEMNIDDAQKRLYKQALELSKDGICIKALVINTALR
jgi:hypothetical protein